MEVATSAWAAGFGATMGQEGQWWLELFRRWRRLMTAIIDSWFGTGLLQVVGCMAIGSGGYLQSRRRGGLASYDCIGGGRGGDDVSFT